MCVLTFEMGMRKLSPKLRMVLVRSTMNTVNAAFSKSVSCTCRRHRRRGRGEKEGREGGEGGRGVSE